MTLLKLSFHVRVKKTGTIALRVESNLNVDTYAFKASGNILTLSCT
jgi:hypothetical protein